MTSNQSHLPFPILPRPNQTATLEYVTPDKAYEYLAANSDRQRLIRTDAVTVMAQDLKAGRWTTTHQGIGFDATGTLIDGQHRLTAIFESGVSVWVWVIRGLEPERAIASVDRGKSRTMANVLQVMGFENSSADTVAIARAMMLGMALQQRNAIPSDQRLAAFITRHNVAIRHAQAIIPRTFGSALLRAVVAKAYYYTAPENLVRFSRAIADDIPAGELTEYDRMARKGTAQSVGGGSAARLDFYAKMLALLRAYLENRIISKVYAITIDPFPLPEGADAP